MMLLAVMLACGPSPGTDSDTADSSASTTLTATDPSTGGATPTTGSTGEPPALGPCGGKDFACGDGQDNDDDGATDLADPECTSPCDDREDSYQNGLSSDGDDCQVDCFFDANSSNSDDGCLWMLGCDPLDPGFVMSCPQQSPAECNGDGAEIPQQCLDRCLPVTPNGCDCFGCCHFDGLFGRDIFLGGNVHCREGNLGACASCTFNHACANPCDLAACELCIGHTELPPGCDVPGCPAQTEPCTVDEHGASNCPPGTYCITGCCAPLDG